MNPQHQQKRKICQSCRLKLYLRPSFIAFFNFSHKRPTFALTPESGYTLGLRRKIAHNGTHAERGGVSDGAAITTLDTYCTFTNIPGPGIRTAYFAAFGSWPGVRSRRTQRAFGTAMRLCASLFRGAAAPLGRVIFSLLPKLRLVHPALSAFRMCETRGGITTLSALYVLLKRRTPACQSG